MKIQKEGKILRITTSSGTAYDFRFAATIEPHKDSNGKIKETAFPEVPDRERNSRGRGPFCEFSVDLYGFSEGVYIFVLNREIQYIGQSKNLERQFNKGFGRIIKRNTKHKGQTTNCKINHAVLEEAKNGRLFDIFVLETSEHKKIKTEILRDFFDNCYDEKPKYNERG